MRQALDELGAANWDRALVSPAMLRKSTVETSART
jgi:hypothetical protein